ncbi:MAG: hypothetical protein JNM19_18215 [Chitinophagaceae bacterium]|nr:hypothetical protein [Chitinophagaceae bacterium]
MKKLLSFLVLLLPVMMLGQSVGIGTNTPDTNAILDITSNSKGLLIPRLTSLQRTSIAGPSIGLTVFDSDTYSFWVYRGDVMGGWREMLIDLDKRWELNGSNIYNTNNGNVGIGTNTPGEKLSINATNAAIQFMNSGTARGYLQVNGTDMKLGTYVNNTTGNIIFNTKAVDRMRIDENGLVGIGTSTGTAALTLNGSNPLFQLRNGDVDKGFVRLSTNDLILGTNAANTGSNIIFSTLEAEKMRLTDDGYLGLGTAAPNSKLHINSTSATDPALRIQINGTSRFIAASNGGIAIGGLQTPPANGLRVIGKSYLGDSVGIGTITPTSMLTINKNPSNFETEFPDIEFKQNSNPVGIITGYDYTSATDIDFQVKNLTTSGRTIISASNNTFGLVVNPLGRTSIGTVNPATGYKLSVDGDIMCEDLTMQDSGSWPDYVFEKDYKLKSLAEVKSFIEANKHLPNVPSAKEMEKTGIRMVEITKKLIEKVEELTLYILQQQEQIDALKKKVEEKQ